MGVRQARAREVRVERVAERARRELLATLEELESRRRRVVGWPRAAVQGPGTQAAAGVTVLTVVSAAAALGWWRMGHHRRSGFVPRRIAPAAGRLSPGARAATARFMLEVTRRAAMSFVTAWVTARARRVRSP